MANQFTLLSELVTTFQGDVIAECFKNKQVTKIKECGDTTMFMTVKGKVFSIYTNLLK